MTTCICWDPVVVDTGGLGYTSEYQEFGTPPAVVQLTFPEVLLLNVIVGFLYPGMVTGKCWFVSVMTNVSVPAVCDVTVKDALPLTA